MGYETSGGTIDISPIQRDDNLGEAQLLGDLN